MENWGNVQVNGGKHDWKRSQICSTPIMSGAKPSKRIWRAGVGVRKRHWRYLGHQRNAHQAKQQQSVSWDEVPHLNDLSRAASYCFGCVNCCVLTKLKF